MKRLPCLAVAVALVSSACGSRDEPAKKPNLPDGVYAVQRDSLKEKEVMPLKDGEKLVVQRHRYLKKDDKPPRYVVVRAAPDVVLELAEAPKAVKEEGSVRIQLKLKAQAAAALERLTRNRVGKEVAIILGGEVVTMHKIRDAIKGGNVEITSCAPAAAEYLLERLRAYHKDK